MGHRSLGSSLLGMAAIAASGLQMAIVRPCISTSCRASIIRPRRCYGTRVKGTLRDKLATICDIPSLPIFRRIAMSSPVKSRVSIRAMSNESKPSSGLPIDLRG